MKTISSKRRFSKRSTILLVVTLLLLLLLSFTAYYYFKQQSDAGEEVAGSSKVAKPDVPSISSQTSSDATSNSAKASSTNNSATDQASSNNELRISAVNQEGDVVKVRTILGSVTTIGDCNISITNQTNNKTYSDTAGVQALASSSSCKGFDIPLSNLSGGTWKIKIDYVVDGKVVSSDTRMEQVDV